MLFFHSHLIPEHTHAVNNPLIAERRRDEFELECTYAAFLVQEISAEKPDWNI